MWTPEAGMIGLGDLPGGYFDSRARDVTADGSIVVGHSSSANGNEAFRWTEADGMTGLGSLGGSYFASFATAINPSGTVIVGTSASPNGSEAFRWTESEGMIGLGDLPGGLNTSVAYAVSADGTTVVGQSSASPSSLEAFRWTASTGQRGLGDLGGGLFASLPYDVSADGVAGCRRRSGSRDDGPRVARVSPDGSRPRTGAGHGARCRRLREGGCHRRSFARSVRALGGVRGRGLSTEMRSNNLKQLEYFDKSKRENRGGAALDVRLPSDGGCQTRKNNWQVQGPPALSAS